MSPEKGPRRHFTHQQFSPNFVPHEYEEQEFGKIENKIAKKFFDAKNKIKKFLRFFYIKN